MSKYECKRERFHVQGCTPGVLNALGFAQRGRPALARHRVASRRPCRKGQRKQCSSEIGSRDVSGQKRSTPSSLTTPEKKTLHKEYLAAPTGEFPHTIPAALKQFIFKSMNQLVFKDRGPLDNFLGEVARLGTRKITSSTRLRESARHRCPLPNLPVPEASLLSGDQMQLRVWIIPGLLGTAVLCVTPQGYEKKEQMGTRRGDSFRGHE